MEQRLARIESHLEHIQFDVTDLKTKFDRLDAKFDARFGKLEAKLDKICDMLAALALNTERSFSRLTRWGLGLAAILLLALAHGFKWI